MVETDPGMALSSEEMQVLAVLVWDQGYPLAPGMAADLERQGLIMRGWNAMHVVTAAGLALLRRSD